jgi:hypothetical protein
MTMDAPPFSHIVAFAEIPAGGRHFDLAATSEECRAIARLFSLPAIESLRASLDVERWNANGLSVTGMVEARLTQRCVVTADAFESDVTAPISVRFSPDAAALKDEEGLQRDIDPTREDPPDPMVDGRIDLGAVATEFLALALDPYPRKPGATFDEPAPEKASPFAALDRLRRET